MPTTLHWDLAVDTDDKANLPPATNMLSTPPTPPAPVVGIVTEAQMDEIMEALEQHNLPGFDYLEFRHALLLTQSSAANHATQFQSALALAKAMGRSPQQLIDDARHYLHVLAQQNQQYEHKILLQITQDIGNIETEIHTLLQSVADKEAQIEKLKLAIAQDQQAIETLKQKAAQIATKIETDKENFAASCQSVQSQIENDILQLQPFIL